MMLKQLPKYTKCRQTAAARSRGLHRPAVAAANANSGSSPVAYQNAAVRTSGRTQVLELLGEGYGLYNGVERFAPAVKQLMTENPTPAPGNESVALGQGTWQVFYAPHIANMSSVLGTRFDPIQYRLSGDALVSNVRFSNEFLGQGWLSAGGSMSRKYDDAVEVLFDRFWVDVGSDNLRDDIAQGAGSALNVDSLVGAIGRSAFFPQLAVFPVLYLDSDLAVFKFTPLDSPIAVYKVAGAPTLPAGGPML